ncbi:FimV family protein [Roseateles sp. BYS87W]|uniref:FimV family protein n=1 Tax=Pelomonas baiyunensis TaxID=3299026 RepID=A0ABW7GX86_9BURK
MPIQALRPTVRGVLTPALALLLGVAFDPAQALGLGRPQVASALGRPLDVSVPLTLAEGEQLSDGCLRAEVTAGDARVPAGLLQLRVEGEPGQQRIRLQSQVRIEEPALRITLALGCPLRLTREFNAFIDPPAGAAPAPAATAAPAPAVTPMAAVLPPASPAATVAAVEPRAKPRAQAASATGNSTKPRVRAKPRPTGPRLTLERPEVLVAEAPRPVQPAASAADMELTPELEAQITQLEATVAQLRAELLARQQAEAGAAAASAASSPASAAPPASAVVTAAAPAPAVLHSARVPAYRDPMTWVMTLALSLMAGAAAFYASRWRDQRARRELAYWRALHAADGASVLPEQPAAAPAAPSQLAPGIAPQVHLADMVAGDDSLHQATRPQPRPMAWPPAGTAAPEIPSYMESTQPMPEASVAAAATPAAMTVADELLDLQQQVDFLQLLGQHESAADLLAARLTQGSASAMPYLLLMELCQQRGELEVFAELVKQFQKRFGALAPDWSQSLASGRSLDGCPSVIAHLQVVWSDPASAMKMLQDLLSQGRGPGVSLFELPSFRDLLTLYSVARDLYESGLRSDGVDLMLPLDSRFGA